MSDALRLAGHLPKVLESLRDTDLSAMEMAAVLRIAAEACQQVQPLQEITMAIAKGRSK